MNLWKLNHSTPMSWCGSASRMIRKVSLQLADFKFRTTAEGPGIHGWTKILPRRFAVRSKKKLQLWYLFCLLNLQITGFHKILDCRQIDVETDYLWIFLAPATGMWVFVGQWTFNRCGVISSLALRSHEPSDLSSRTDDSWHGAYINACK